MALWRFRKDNIRTKVTEEAGGERAGKPVGEIDDAQPLEGCSGNIILGLGEGAPA